MQAVSLLPTLRCACPAAKQLTLVSLLTNESVDVPVDADDTIYQLLVRAGALTLTSLEHLRLYWHGQLLRGYLTLKDYGVDQDPTIFVAKEIIVYVRSIDTFETFAVPVNPKILVRTWKWRVEHITGYPASQQQLIFWGQTMLDQNSLEYHNIAHQQMIHVTMRRM